MWRGRGSHCSILIPGRAPCVQFMNANCKLAKLVSALLCILLSLNTAEGANVSATDMNSTTGQFLPFASAGIFTTSNDEPHRILVGKDNEIFIGGTTSPLERGQESDLGLPLDSSLKNEDIFLAKIDGTIQNDSSVRWVFRAGTSKEDRLHAMLLDESGKFLYVAGRTFGILPGTSFKGLSDLFILKYDVSGDKPEEVWEQPLVLGTISSEAVFALASDPSDPDVIYATGFTSGSLFRGHSPEGIGDTSDAILFSFSASRATVYHSIQFGTDFGDQGAGIVVSNDASGPLFVSVVTDRQIGQYSIGNFHLYKFTRSLAPLGDVLLRTYSREDVVGFKMHPFLADSLIVTGSSWLDSRNENDVFVKRVVRAFDVKDINSTEIDIDEVESDEYTSRLQSSDGSHDYATGLVIDENSGRLIVCGHTGGMFANGGSNVGKRAPFIGLIDPNDGSMTDAVQMKLDREESWIEVSDIAMKAEKDGVYFTFKVSNETSRQFYVKIGRFLFPSSWKERIVVQERPSPSPKGFVRNDGETESLPIGIIIGAAGGGLVVIVVIIGWISWMRIRKRAKNAMVYDRSLVNEASFVKGGGGKRERVVGAGMKGRRSSELV